MDGINSYRSRCDNIDNSAVKMYGTQTSDGNAIYPVGFENDVKMYGTQTYATTEKAGIVFENDVKMYGTQTWMLGAVARV